VFDAFAREAADHTVVGLANSRTGGERNHRKLNLLDFDAVSTFIRETKPDCKCNNMTHKSTSLLPFFVLIPVKPVVARTHPPPHLRKSHPTKAS
jgi:hypothetical protein